MIAVMVLSNFVVLEGTDGSGTTSQLRLLKERIAMENKEACTFFTQEPTGGSIGTLIRSALQGSQTFAPETMARLFAADRCEHIYGQGGIKAQLDAGKAVFTDRYLFSSLAYQTAAGAGALAKAQNEGFPLPEYLFFFDLPVNVSMDRVLDRSNILEIYEEPSFQNKVRDEYLHIMDFFKEKEPDMKIVFIDAQLPPEEIQQKLWSIVENLPKI